MSNSFVTPMDCSQPGSSVYGISQAGILEYSSEDPSPKDLPQPGIKPVSPALSGRSFTIEPSGKPNIQYSNTPYVVKGNSLPSTWVSVVEMFEYIYPRSVWT